MSTGSLVIRGKTIPHGVLIGGACVLIAMAGLFGPSSPAKHGPGANEPAAKEPPPAPSASTSWTPDPEPRVTFAHTMPRGQGAQIFNNTGRPNLGMVMVAIPAGPKTVRFVRGTDPQAVKYLAEVRAEQKRIRLDKGPADVDLSETANLGPLKGRTTRRARNLAADDDAHPPPDVGDSPPLQ